MSDLPETDWKYMRALESTLLERLCQRINQQMTAILEQDDLSAYQRYHKIYQKTKTADKEIARAFDDWRRSTLFSRMLEIDRQQLMTAEEQQRLSAETRQRLDSTRRSFATMV